MSDGFTITDDFIASTLASVPDRSSVENYPIEIFSRLIQMSIGGHIILAPGLSIQDAFNSADSAIPEASLLPEGKVVIHGRQTGLWRPFLFWHDESEADINALWICAMVDADQVDGVFIQNMDYLRNNLRAVAPPIYYMSVDPAFGPDGNSKIGFTVEPNMVGAALITMNWLPLDSLV